MSSIQQLEEKLETAWQHINELRENGAHTRNPPMLTSGHSRPPTVWPPRLFDY